MAGGLAMGVGSKRRVVAVVSLTTAFTCVGIGAQSAAPVSWRTTGGPLQHDVAPGDSLVTLGARYGIDWREIALANGLKPGVAIPPGSILQLDNRHVVPAVDDGVTLVINVPQRMLFLAVGESVEGFPVALGRRDWPTPLGEFSVVAKEENPTWEVPASIQAEMRREGRTVLQRVAPGPANPLGAFWLGLSLGSVGVHGTNAPSSIFRHVTHGCVRMHPDDVARLYPLVPLGARGRVVYEPVLLAHTGEGIFLESHPDIYARTGKDPLAFLRDRAAGAGLSGQIDWAEAVRVLRARAGIARRIDRILTESGVAYRRVVLRGGPS